MDTRGQRLVEITWAFFLIMNKIVGIYKVTNPVGAVYIGESKDIEKRWKTYEKLKCKAQRKLYNSFIKYGFENHIFEIVKECIIEEIPYYERHYQEYYDVLDKEYGLNLKLTKIGDKKQVHSEETRKKQSESQKGKKHSEESRKKMSEAKKNMSEGTKQKMSESKKGKTTWMKGKKHTEETLKKMSDANKGKKLSDATKEKIGKAGKGRRHTEETRKKMSKPRSEETRKKMSDAKQKMSEETKRKISESSKGKTMSEEARKKMSKSKSKKAINIQTNEIYNSVTEMCEILGLKCNTMKPKLCGLRKNNTPFQYL
jgi:hypothetical protein